MSEPDPEQETLETLRRTVSTTFLAATQAAERISRRREQDVRQAEAVSTQRSQELRQRLEVEKSTARATTAQARRPDFWANANVNDVARTYQTAASWAERDPAIDADRRLIAAGIRARYGVDVTDTTELATLATVQHQSHLDRGEANQAHDEYAAATAARDAALAVVDPDNSTEADEHAHTAGENAYDSAEARAARSEARRNAGLNEAAVRSYGYTDLAQAKPASEAVATTPPRSLSPASSAHGRSVAQQNSPRLGH